MPYHLFLQNVVFPVPPSKMTIKVNGNNKTVNLINEGDVNLIKTSGLTEIELEDVLIPAFVKYPFAEYIKLNTSSGAVSNDTHHRAKYYLDKLESFKKSSKPILFLLSRTTPNGQNLLFDTRMNVTVEDYTINEDASNGLDFYVNITLKEYRDFGAKKLVVKSTKKTSSSTKSMVQKKKTTTKKKTTAKTYTVKNGDTLPNIAKKQLGSSKYSTKIYNLNKTVIENAAKKHGRKSSSKGWWLYIGTKLKLPSV